MYSQSYLNHHSFPKTELPIITRTSDLCFVYRKRRLSLSHLYPLHLPSWLLMETLAKQLAGAAGVLSRMARLSPVPSSDFALTSTAHCSTRLMTSNTSHQKWDSLKGEWGEEADKHSVSLHMQSEGGHNYQDVSADTETLPVQISGPLRNEQAELAREGVFLVYLSWVNTENQHVGGMPEKPLNGKREDPFWDYVTRSVCLHQCGSHK